METIKTTIKSEAIFSDDKKHRVLLHREWERNRPTATIIMINPSKSTAVQSDLTTTCVLNNLERLDYGAVDIVNLYSQVTSKIEFRFSPDEELLHPENDSHIVKSAEKSSIVILAWGQIGENNKRVRLRQLALLEKLKPHEHKLKIICDQKGRSGLHPLTPQIRNGWELKPFAIEKWKAQHIPEKTENPDQGQAQEPQIPAKTA